MYLDPGYEDYPKGYTVGPIDNISSLSNTERTKYLLDNLPQFNKVGWMTEDTMKICERHLKAGTLDTVIKRVEQDLKNQVITTEVSAIIQAMK